jgi:hypothetical protein
MLLSIPEIERSTFNEYTYGNMRKKYKEAPERAKEMYSSNNISDADLLEYLQ